MLTKKTQGGYDKPFINAKGIISNEWSILEWRIGIAFTPNAEYRPWQAS